MLALALATCQVATAQPPADSLESDEELGEANSAVVATALSVIESRRPETPSELLESVSILQQLGAYPEARVYLEQLAARTLDPRELALAQQQIGNATLLRLAADKQLWPQSQEFVRRVLAAARKVNSDPERLQRLIDQLSDADAEQRRVAMIALAAMGAHSVPALFDAIRDPVHLEIADRLQDALALVGRDGADALIAALGCPDPLLQAVSARALGRAGIRRSAAHLIRPALIGPGQAAEFASASLQQLGESGSLPIGGSVALLRRLAVRHLNGEPPFPPAFDGTLEMWTWDAESGNVVLNMLTAHEASAVAAARLAKDAYELDPSSENARLLLVSRLQVDQLLGGQDKLLPSTPGSAYAIGNAVGLKVIRESLVYALNHHHHAAVIGATQLLAEACVAEEATHQSWAPLTRALRSPNRRIRYAAARAIMRIDPRQSYAGASFMMDALIDLAETSGSTNAIVATPRADVADRISGMLGSLGFTVHRANSARACLIEAMRASDYDVVLLSDSVTHPTVDEVVQQLRKDPQSSMVPVILLSRQDRVSLTEHVASLDDLAIAMPEFADETTLIAKLEAAERTVATFSVPPSRRLEQSKDALRWLAHLAAYDQTYPWYDVMRARAVALRATSQPELLPVAIDLLGAIGDARAQKRLADLASQKSRAADDRQRAANALAEAVNRRGLMLRHSEVNAQYDRYNASESDDATTQEILGQVLDVIETQTRATSTSVND